MKKLLDVGCGPGTINNIGTYGRFKKNFEIYGIDVSKEAVNSAKKRFPAGNFKLGRGEEIPYPAKTFDCVLAKHVLEHVNDPKKILSEIYRVGKEGSSLIIAVPHPNMERILNVFLPENLIKGLHHERVYDDKNLKKLLEKNGFSVVSTRNRKWPIFLFNFLLSFSSRFFKKVSMESQSGVFSLGKNKYLEKKEFYFIYSFIYKIIGVLDNILFLNFLIPFELEVRAVKKPK